MSVSRRVDVWAGIVVLGMIVVLLVMLGRVVQLQTRPGPDLAQHMDARLTTVREPGVRGDLLDRRGRLLAASRFGYRVFVDPLRLPEDPGAYLVPLSDVTGVPVEELASRILPKVALNERLLAEKTVGAAHSAGPAPASGLSAILAALIPENAGEDEGKGLTLSRYLSIGGVLEDWRVPQVRELAKKIPGVHLEHRAVRELTAPELVAPIVGAVNIDHAGILGAERMADGAVRASAGRLRFVRDAKNRPLWVEKGGYEPPKRGEDVKLALDLELQRIAQEELERGVRDADAAGGRLVMIDPDTGEVVAMVDIVRQPADAVPFDWDNPHAPGSDGGRRRYITIRQSPNAALHPALARNRCVEDVYEPGSTFKPFMWAAATELGLADPDEVIDTENGAWRTAYGRPLSDVVRRATMTWADVLVNSSNIGMAKVTRRMSDDQMHGAVVRFGFGKRTGIGLPGESPGIVTSRRRWSKYTQTSVAMGHEIAVTPIQIARAFTAFARVGEQAGTIASPRLWAASSEGETVEAGSAVRVLPARIAELTRQTMRGVAVNAERRMMQAQRSAGADPVGVVPGSHYEIFGKSGTAEIPLGSPPPGKKKPRGSAGYFEDQYNSSFLAAAPADRPRLVLLVVIDDPGPELVRKKLHRGSAVAYPVVKRVFDRALPYLGVPPTPVPAEAPAAVASAGGVSAGVGASAAPRGPQR